MSNTVDERVVILQFNNAQFESNVQQSITTLQKLKTALNLEGSAKGLEDLNRSAKTLNFNHVADNIQTVADRFSALGIVGDQVMRRLTDSAINLGKSLLTAIPKQIISGGKKRAQNIAQAKFMLEGLLGEAYDWEKIQKDINYAVSGTAYGFDEAASAAGQLAASSVEFGDDMKAALRGISGVAAMTNDEYTTIAQIFTKIAGQGKVMTQELNQLAAHGLNVAATIAKTLGTTEAEVRAMVTDGAIDFKTFAYAMDDAFGEHATKANDTFTGVLRNIKAALSRMGEQFATPAYENLRIIMVELLYVLKDVEQFIKPISAAFKDMAEAASGFLAPALLNLHTHFANLRGLTTDYSDYLGGFLDEWVTKLQGKTKEEIKELGLLQEREDDLKAMSKWLKEEELYDPVAKKSYFDERTFDTQAKEVTDYIDSVISATSETAKVVFDVAEAAEAVETANEAAETSAKNVQKEYKKTSSYAKSFSNVQEAVANSTKTSYSELENYGVIGKALSKKLDKLTRQEQKRAEATSDLSTANARNEKISVEAIERGIQSSKKENLVQRIKNGLIKKTGGLLGKVAQGAADFLGFNKETVKALASEEQMQQVVDDLANRVWKGEFGNGEDRVKALGELGAAYSIVQNRVNELLGCEKRHTVTAEDEAKMMEYVCKTLGISSKEGKRIASILDNLSTAFAAIVGLLEMIKTVGLALFNEVIRPFLKTAFQTIFDIILKGLAAIGNVILDIYEGFDPEKVTQFFVDFREKVVAFWEAIQQLEGVKKLKEAWGNFKLMLEGLKNKVLDKITEKFGELRQQFKLPEGSFFLNIINNITNGLSHFIDILSLGVGYLGDFFSPLFDWVVSIPGKLRDFWDSLWGKGEGEAAGEGISIFDGILKNFTDTINNFIDSIAPLKAVKDFLVGFWDSIFGKKDKKGGLKEKLEEFAGKKTGIAKIWDSFTGKGNGPLTIATVFENLKRSVNSFIESIAPLKAAKDWLTGIWDSIFGKKGEGKEGGGIGAAFENLKKQISDFMDSVPILKNLKDWFAGIFNENLLKSVEDVKAAIGDFFKALFPAEEAEGEVTPFFDRFTKAAEALKAKLAEIFTSEGGANLGKVLLGSGGIIGALVALFNLITGFNKNQNGGGIAGAIFGSARGGLKLTSIVPMVLAIVAALNLLENATTTTTENGEQKLFTLEGMFNAFLTTISNFKNTLVSYDIPGTILRLLFGTKDESGQKVTNGLIDNLKQVVTDIVTALEKTLGVLFGGSDNKLGFGNAAKVLGIIAAIASFIGIFKVLSLTLSSTFNIFKSAAGVITDVRIALDAYATNTKANTLYTIAKGISMLALSLAALALVPAEGFYRVVGLMMWLSVIIGAFYIVGKVLSSKEMKKAGSNETLATFSNINSIVLSFARAIKNAFAAAATAAGFGLLMIGLATSVGILVGAISKIGNDPNADKGTKTVIKLIATMAIAVGLLMILSKKFGALKGGATFLAFAVSILIVVQAISMVLGIVEEHSDSWIAAIRLLALVIGAFTLISTISMAFKGNTAMIGLTFLSLSAGLIAFALACKVLETVDFKTGIAPGLQAMVVALAALTIMSFGKNSISGNPLMGLAVSLLALAAASIMFGKYWDYALKGLVALGIAIVVLSGALTFLPVGTHALISFSNSLKDLGIGIALIAVAMPLLAWSFQKAGEIFLASKGAFIAGGVAFIAVIAALAAVSTVVTPQILALGQALMLIAGAFALVWGTVTDFKGIRSLISELGGAFGDIFGSFLNLPGSLLKTNAQAVKESGTTYKSAVDDYAGVLKNISGLSDTARAALAEKMEGLKELNGSAYVMGIKDIVGYIKNLNIDEDSKNAAIWESLTHAEEQQSEQFTMTIYKLQLTLEEHGATQEQIDAIFEQLEDAFRHSPGAVTAVINEVHTYIEGLNLSEGQKDNLIEAFDAAVQAQVRFRTAVNDLDALIDNNPNVDVDGKDELKSAVDNLLSNWTYDAELGAVNEKIDRVNIKNKPKLRRMITEALKFKVAFQTQLGTIYALVENAEVDPEKKEEIRGKIDAALEEIYKGVENGEITDEEQVKAKLKDIKVEVLSVATAGLTGQAKEDVEKLVNDEFDKLVKSYWGFHASMKDIHLFITGSDLSDEEASALNELVNALMKKNENNPIEIAKLWARCKELGMTTADLKSFLEQLGITIDEQTEKTITLSGVEVLMEDYKIPEEDKQPIRDALETVENLDINDGEYEQKRKAAIDMITEITHDREKAEAMVDEYLGEARDMQNASLTVLEAMIESMTFGTETERLHWLQRVRELYGKTGEALKSAMDDFTDDLANHSSISDSDLKKVQEQAGKVIDAQIKGINEKWLEFQKAEAEYRRRNNIGSFVVDTTTGSTIAANSKAAEIMKDTLSDVEEGVKELSVNDYFEMIERFNESGATWEDWVSSFENTGYTDAELREIFFPDGGNKMVWSMEGYNFMKTYGDAYLDGTSKAYKEEVSKYGTFDFAAGLSKYFDEETGKFNDYDITMAFGINPGFKSMKEAQEFLAADLAGLEDILGKKFKSFKELYDYFIQEQSEGRKIQGLWLPQFLSAIQEQVNELTEGKSEEEATAAIENLFGAMDRTLNKTGDGINRSASKAEIQIKSAFDSLESTSQGVIRSLREKFDADGLFQDDATFYDFLKNGLFGIEGMSENLNIDEMLEKGMNADQIMDEFVKSVTEAITTSDPSKKMTQEMLIALYKQFPDFREILQGYLNSQNIEVPEEFKTSEINKKLEEQEAAFKETMQEIADDASEGKTGSQDAMERLWNMIVGGEISQAEATKYANEMGLDFGAIFGEMLNTDLSNMDTTGVVSSLWSGLAGMEGDVKDKVSELGLWFDQGMNNGAIENMGLLWGSGGTAFGSLYGGAYNAGDYGSPSGKAKKLGLWFILGFGLGISQNLSKAKAAGAALVSSCFNAVKDKVSSFGTQGSRAATAYGAGISSKLFYVFLAGVGLVTQAIAGLKSLEDRARQLGNDFGDGYVKGIGEKVEAARTAGAELTAASVEGGASKDGIDVNSPSKKMIAMGNSFGEGYIIGMQQFGTKVHDAGADLASTAIDTIRNPLQIVQDFLNSDLDTDPTIRPVMDISAIQNGVKTINGMIPETEMGLNFISKSMGRVKMTNEDVVSAISGLSKQMEGMGSGDTYNVNGVTYDDGTNISTAVRSLVHAVRIERRS